MLRPEWEKIQDEFYRSQHLTKGLVEICQDFHDQEILKLKAEHAVRIEKLLNVIGE